MKKKISILFVILTLFAAFMLFACDTKQALPAPANLQINGNLLTWDAVDGASGYSVEIDGNIYSADAACFDLSGFAMPKTYNIRVIAKGNGIDFGDSAWSDVKEYINTPQPKLSTPANLRIGGASLTWDAVDHASGYWVEIDGSGYGADGTFYDLSGIITPGIYKIRVMAIGDGVAFAGSDWSAGIDHTVGEIWPGDGTEENPYILSTKAQLLYLANKVNSVYHFSLDKYFVLGADIDLEGMEWTPIGNGAIYSGDITIVDHVLCFEGDFDGGGFAVKNFVITDSRQNAGLFGNNQGTIQNLGVTDFLIDIEYFTTNSHPCGGGLTGINAGTILNCYATGDVNVTSPGGVATAGGLVGSNYDGSIAYSYAIGNVTATSSKSFASYAQAGGLVGSGGTIANCYAAGDVNSLGAGAYAGGLAGYGVTIVNSYATGNVSAVSVAPYDIGISDLYPACAGGLAGIWVVYEGSAITNCYATGNVSVKVVTSDAYAGGLIGRCYGETDTINCYRFEAQTIEIDKEFQVSVSINDSGTPVLAETFGLSSFYTDILEWDDTVWDLTGTLGSVAGPTLYQNR